ncbi:unnamed protein product [Orchesella dallaii]|uniref:Odorant receptor n=1 Tax=Orchesella dallaii TaxID=48710 RepID=A0ABP1QCQ3_9HEXA
MFYHYRSFIRALMISEKLYGIGFRWNESKKLVELSPKRHQIQVQLYGYLQIVFTVGIFIQTCLKNATISNVLQIIDLLVNGNLIAWMAFGYKYRKSSAELVGYINGHQKLMLKCMEQTKLNMKFMKLFTHSLLGCSIVAPIGFNIGMKLVNECTQSSLLYWIKSECRFGDRTRDNNAGLWIMWMFVKKTFVLIINQALWQYGISTAVFCMMLMALGALNLRVHLKTFRRTCSAESPKVLLYRKIQLLANLYNGIHQEEILTVVLICGPTVLAFALNAIVKIQMGIQHLLPLMMFVAIASNSIFIIVGMLGVLAEVCRESRDALWCIKRDIDVGATSRNRVAMKSFRMFLKSCSPIQIKFGSSNYLEPKTPLRCLDAAVSITVNLLLLKV